MRGSFITFLPQEPNLITNLSIFDNLKIFFPDVSLSDIKRSMVLAGCASWLSECESILDLQLVSELSRGQQQQLCIVRAFLDPKPIWLLDEALSAVDIHTHQKIMFNITHHPMIKKIILISHQKRDHYLCQAMMSINHQSNETYSSLSICQ
jgi:ABC-type transport system involved in cytochrome bd biosynthesis fused ATPase/permease subunit